MAVDWSIPIRYADMAMRQQVADGQAQHQFLQNQAAHQKLIDLGMQRQARPAIQQQVASGDYRGAQAAAIGTGDIDLAKSIGALDADQRKRLDAEGQLLGRAMQSLKRVPLDQRPTVFMGMLPHFRRQGFSADELRGMNDFSDEMLDQYIGMSQSVKDHLASDLTQARIDDIGADNERADLLADNTMRNTSDMMEDRAARRGLTRRSQDMADARGRYGIGVASRDRQRGQDLSHDDRVAARDEPRRGRGDSGQGGAPSNPSSIIPGATPELPVTVTSVAQAKMLPKGTYIRTPQGKTMRVP